MVTEQIANLSTRKCRLGSSPSLSAFALHSVSVGGHLYQTWRATAVKTVRHNKYKITATAVSGCSVARLSRLLWEQEVAGSNPATPTVK